jgi:hypothetical protein
MASQEGDVPSVVDPEVQRAELARQVTENPVFEDAKKENPET